MTGPGQAFGYEFDESHTERCRGVTPRRKDEAQPMLGREGSSMTVEYFGRQYEITPGIKDEVESGLGKLKKILGDNFKSKVILTAERHRNIAEITVSRRRGQLIGLAEATEMTVAVSQALEHIETQALRHNGRRRTTTRKAKDKT